MMNCRELMNQTIRVCSGDDSVEDCVTVMREHSLPMLLVLGRNRDVIGVVSHDAARRASTREQSVSAAEIMSTELRHCRPDDDASVAAKLLGESNVPAVFVTENDCLLGWLGAQQLQSHASGGRRPVLPDKKGRRQRSVA